MNNNYNNGLKETCVPCYRDFTCGWSALYAKCLPDCKDCVCHDCKHSRCKGRNNGK